MMMIVARLMVIFLCLFYIISSSLYAQDKIYWVNQRDKKIQRSNLDGSSIEDIVTSGLNRPYGIAIDNIRGKVYWTDFIEDKIKRSNLDGTNVEIVRSTNLNTPLGIEIDRAGEKIYWVDGDNHKVNRANLNGSSPETLVSSISGRPIGIALDISSGKVYWTVSGPGTGKGSVQRANLDGSNVENLANAIEPNGIAMDLPREKMYWINGGRVVGGYFFDDAHIMRANLNGTNAREIINKGTGFKGLMADVAIDTTAQKIYWTESVSSIWESGNEKIRRANLDGSNIEDLITEISGNPTPIGVALLLGYSPPAPLADFIGSPTSGPAPLEVRFTDRSSGNVSQWLWSFGDGQTSALKNPTHVYADTGSYIVSLTVTGPGGANTKSRSSYIQVSAAAPSADFTASPTSGQVPLTVQFTDQSIGNITSWLWDFGDNQTSTIQNPIHVYADTGKYTVYLTVTGPDGSDTKARENFISVFEPIIVDFIAAPTRGLAPLTVQFTDRSTGKINSWQWNFGDGETSTLTNPTHTYSTPGSYTVGLTATGPAGSSTEERIDYIIVSKTVLVQFTATPQRGQKPLIVQFLNQSIGDFEDYFWSFGDGQISTMENPIHTYETSGYYTVSLTVTGSDGAHHKTMPNFILVKDTILPPGTIKWSVQLNSWDSGCPVIGPDGTIYHGRNVFYAISPEGKIKWEFDHSDISTSAAIGDDGTIYVGSSRNDGNFFALNPDGSIKWTFHVPGEGVTNTPAIDEDGTIYIGWSPGTLYAINPDGTEKWSFAMDSYNSSVFSSAAIGSDGTIYIGEDYQEFYAINPDGTEKWRYRAWQIFSSPAIGTDETIYVGNSNYEQFYAFNPAGTERWSFSTDGSISSSPAIGADGTIYFGCEDANLYAINPTGTKKWTFKTGDKIRDSSPLVGSDGVVYIGSYDGFLYAVNSDGTLNWKIHIGGLISSSPTIAFDGTIYMTSANPDEKLYAINSSSVGLADSPWPKFHQNVLNSGFRRHQGPKAKFFANPNVGIAPLTVQFVNQSIGYFDEQLWVFGDGDSSTVQNPTHIYDSVGNFSVSLTVEGQSGTDTKSHQAYISVIDPTRVDDHTTSLSMEYEIYQNYPNPFNPTTTINFAIPKSSLVTLKIYNLLGKEIETLINEQRQAGEYKINWAPLNLPSGIYLYRLQAGDFDETRKLMLLK